MSDERVSKERRAWVAALILSTVGCRGGGRQKVEPALTTCLPVTVAAFHEEEPVGWHPFLPNQRLARIDEDGRVPCVDVETAEPTTCRFEAGNWLEDGDGNRYAQVGQPIAKDDTPLVGDHVVAARTEGGAAPCVAATGHDAAGYIEPGSELGDGCAVEYALASYNSLSAYSYTPLSNYADLVVCSSNNSHPDGANMVSEDPATGVRCWTGVSAALNDLNGTERDLHGMYFGSSDYCHFLASGGLIVPAAKRPATRSLPVPGAVVTTTPILWRPVNPLLQIANSWELGASAPVPRPADIVQQPQGLTVAEGQSATFTVAATGAPMIHYQWFRNGAPVAGATAPSYQLPAASLADDGALYHVEVQNYWGSATSAAATLRVTPGAVATVTLTLLPVVGLREQAEIPAMTGIDRDPGGSFTFITSQRIKRLSADLTTITPVAGGAAAGAADGPAAAAAFNQPAGLTQDGAGNIYVADTGNHTIRRIAADGTVTTLAGRAGASGATDGAGAAARFATPTGIATGPDGALYVAELDNHRIRRVTTAGVVTTYAGGVPGYLDADATAARFNAPTGVAVAANGDVLVADTANNRIRRIARNGDAAGTVSTLAGDGTASAGSPDGAGAAAVIPNPRALVVRGNVLTVRDSAGLLRQIDLGTAQVTTLAGSRLLGEGYADGAAASARIRNSGVGLTTAANGGFMIADDLALRLVGADGAVTTIAAARAVGAAPNGVGTLAQMPFSATLGAVAVDPAGNVVIADRGARVIRSLDPAGAVTLVAGLAGSFGGAVDGIGSGAQFGNIGDAITSVGEGTVYVGDGGAVRAVSSDGTTTLVAGVPSEPGAVDGGGAAARFSRIFGLAAAPDGSVFVGDGNSAVRRIDLQGNVTTYAGVMGQPGRVDGPIASARFENPGQVALGPDGALYVVERLGGVIRRVAPDGGSVSTLPVSGLTGSLVADAEGTLYFGTTGGLAMLPAGGAPVVLVPQGPDVVLGAAPRLPSVDGLAVLGPKQLVVLSAGQLLKATRP